MKPVPIIIPVKDRVALTRQTVDSIFKNTKVPFELIIISDNSNDKTNEYLQSLGGKARIFIMPDSKGPGACRNTGAAIADADEFLYFTDNDIYYLEGWLGKMLEVMGAYPELGILGGRTHEYHGYRIVEERGGHRIRTSNQQSGYSILTRKNVWLKCGPFYHYKVPEGLGKEDVRYCDAVHQQGWEVAHMETPVLLHCGLRNTFGDTVTGIDSEAAQEFPPGVITA